MDVSLTKMVCLHPFHVKLEGNQAMFVFHGELTIKKLIKKSLR
jgi:hypothetical protein